MNITGFSSRIKNACDFVVSAQNELTEIDSRFGDADHGVTMTKIAKAIEDAAISEASGFRGLLDDAAMNVMMINGGSAVPLWNTWLDGLCELAPEGGEASIQQLIKMFDNAQKSLSALSKAKPGDKTMMDTLIPATKAITDYAGDDEAEMFVLAASAAAEGAESTKNFVSKFGRARSYGEETLGTPDAGAMSMMYFFAGLAKA